MKLKFYISFFFMCFLTIQFSFASFNLDSLENELKTVKDTNRAKILYKIAHHEYNSQPQKCMKYVVEAAEIYKKFGLKKMEASSYSIAGVIHKNHGEFEKALEFQLKSLVIAEKLDEKKLLASTLNDLGVLYKNLQEFETAIEYYERALKIIEELGYTFPRIMIINNIGTIYVEIEQEDKAMEYYNKALDLSKENDMIGAKAICLNNIGELLVKRNKLEEALRYFLETHEIDKTTGDKFGGVYTLLNLGATYCDLKDYSNSIKHYNLALTDAVELNATMLESKIYAGLAESYEQMNDSKKALYYFKKFKLLNDSVFNQDKSKQIAEMQTKYETEKKEKENQLLEQENQLQLEEIAKKDAQKKVQIISFIAAILLIIGIVIRYYYRNKMRQQKVQEEHQQQRFKAVIEAEEKERIRIAKDLHDGLGQLLSTAKINMTSLEGELADKEDEVLLNNSMALVDEAVTEVRNISHNMMPSALIDFGLPRAIEALTSRINDAKLIKVNFSYSGLDERLEQSTEIALFRIIQEVLNNMIKHSEAAEISIDLERINKKVLLKIEDNGKGFDVSKIDQSKGIGWKNIYSRLSMINGQIDIKSGLDKGTVINIDLVI
ncbi:tetratricopeptide repeat protein [Bacteroidota bacterium]